MKNQSIKNNIDWISIVIYVVLVVLCERRKERITLFLKSLKYKKILNLLLLAFIFSGFLIM